MYPKQRLIASERHSHQAQFYTLIDGQIIPPPSHETLNELARIHEIQNVNVARQPEH